jgi:hypothetical protein
MRRAEVSSLALGLATLAACAVNGAPVGECDSANGEARPAAIVRPPTPNEVAEALTIECWSEVRRERLELWFTYPAESGCWELSKADVRESGDAIAITLWATPAPVCPSDAGREARTQIDLQGPIADRRVLDGSR